MTRRSVPLGSRALATALVLTCLGGPLHGQVRIPPHPRMLLFSEPSFEAPKVDDYRIELPGGAVGIVAPDHSLPLVDIAVAVRVGSFVDPVEKPGLASLTGSLMRRAGAGDLAADDFDDRVALLGARMNSFAGIARGGASLSVLRADLEQGLDLFFDMMRQPRFDEDRIDATRRTLLENMRRRNEDPLDILEREWEWLLWGIDSFATRPLTEAALANIGRQDMTDLHRSYWHPANMVFAVSGDVTREEAARLLSERLEAWAAPDGAVTPDTIPPLAGDDADLERKPGAFLIAHDTPQAKVRLGRLVVPAEGWSESDQAVLAVMNEVLGGTGAISRLSGRLRTSEGLVYRANSVFDTTEPWTGEFRVFFDSANESVERAVELCLEEIGRLRTESVHPQELEVVKETLLARLRQSFDSAEEVAGYLADDALTGREPGYWQRRYELIQSVTAEQVRQAATSYLRADDLVVLAVGRVDSISSETGGQPSRLEQLTAGKVTRLPLRDPLSMALPPTVP